MSVPIPVKTCSFLGCPRRASSKGLCRTHYGRLSRFGDAAGKKLNCGVCGMEFIRAQGRALTCSSECSSQLKRERKRKFDSNAPSKRVERICASCGAGFVGSTNQVTCSATCRKARLEAYEVKRLLERRKTKQEVSCVWCDQLFVPMTQAKSCSPDCSSKYTRAKRSAKGKGLFTKNCVICKTQFKTGGTSNRVITCSPSCRAKRSQEQLDARRESVNTSRRGERNRKGNLFRRFGITEVDYLRMFDEQGGCCAICGTSTPGTSGVFAVDHDHSTGRVRGLLCRGCNIGIGNLGDDAERLESAVRYLRNAKQ
jgi:hypothetical protein